MGMEQSNSINYLSENVRKSTLEKQLDFQEATRPNISEEYYTPAIDFMARFYVSEYYTGLNYEAFPKEFRDYVNNVPRNTILGNGAIKVAVMKIANTEKDQKNDIEDRKARDLIKMLVKDLKQEYGLAATIEYSKNSKNNSNLDEYIACFPGKVIKNEKGDWIVEEVDGANAKFFAVLVARGLIDEQFILEDNMANLGTKGIKFRKDFLQALDELKNKGMEKIVEEPLYKV